MYKKVLRKCKIWTCKIYLQKKQLTAKTEIKIKNKMIKEGKMSQ